MAEKDKVFYWIKLKKEFMDGETIDFLMSQKNGANYVVLYQMLIMKTINTNGKLCNEIGEMLIPFDIEKIQRDCKWFDIDTVRVAMELFTRLGLIYKNNENVFQIANFEDLVGSETYWAKQKRLQLTRKQEENEKSWKISNECPTNFQENVQEALISNISNLKSNTIIDNKEENNNIQPNTVVANDSKCYQEQANASVETVVEVIGETKNKQKHKYGEYKNVLLTDEQYENLKEKFPFNYEEKIRNLDEGIELKGYKYKNHYLAILKWASKDNNKQETDLQRAYKRLVENG